MMSLNSGVSSWLVDLSSNNHLTNSWDEFTRRQANEVAHALAGEATLSASPIIYCNPMYCINNIMFNEML